MHERDVGSPQLWQSYADRLAGVRVLEQQALQLFTDLAGKSGNEVLTSLLRATAVDTGIQIARLDRLLRASGTADNTEIASASDGESVQITTMSIEKSGTKDGGVDDALLDLACRSLRNQIEGYESACAVARQLDDYAALDVLLQCLDEDLATNAALCKLTTRRKRLVPAVQRLPSAS